MDNWHMVFWQADDGEPMFHAVKGTEAEAEAWAREKLAVEYTIRGCDGKPLAVYGRRRFQGG